MKIQYIKYYEEKILSVLVNFWSQFYYSPRSL